MSEDKFDQLMNKVKFNPDTAKQLAYASGEAEPDEDLRRSYKLKSGDNLFRIIPFEDGSVIKVVWVHMNLGVPFLCPSKIDKSEKCPECDFGWEMYNRNNKKHTDDSRNFLAQEKWFVRGIVRNEEKEDIEKYGYPRLRFLDLSPTNGKTVLSYFDEKNLEEWGDISDLFNGRDLKFKKDEEKAKQRQASVSIERQPTSKPALTSVKTSDPAFKKIIVSMFENGVDHSTRFEKKNYTQILEMMDKFKKKISASSDSFSEASEEFSKASSSLSKDSNDFDEIMKQF